MGSAMCFPVEAMVFYTLILSAMHQLDGIRPSYKSISKYSTLIDIYGDDLIVPIEYTDVVVRYLESYALKVNINKSFRNSLFRESCGADYYDGVDVKPVYARQLAPDAARDWLPEHVMAWTATANQLYMTGQWHVAQVVRDMVSSVVGRPIPRCRVNGDGVFFFSYLFTTGLRYNTQLHGWQQKRTIYTPLKRKDIIDGDPIACFNRVFASLAKRDDWNSSNGIDHANGALSAHEAWKIRDASSSIRLHSEAEHDGSPTGTEPGSVELLQIRGRPGQEDSEGYRDISDVSLRLDRGSLQYRNEPSSAKAGTLTHLTASFEVDFVSSTYRGRYKPKYRWIAVSQP
jgi:hypothetical protein